MKGAGKPLVSVITATYNRAGFIEDAARSVLNQTYKNFEHVIVDDGSTDNTKEVLTPFLIDPRFRYFRQENQGQSIARDEGIKNSVGELVCFIDSDDIWMPDKLERQVRLLFENPHVGVVHGDEIMINEQGQEVSRKNMARHSGRISHHLIIDNSVSINTAMVRRECIDLIGGFPLKYRVADDYALWLNISAYFNFLYVPQYFGYYRIMHDQISSNIDQRIKINERIVTDFIEEFPFALRRDLRRRSLSLFYCRKARVLSSLGKRSESIVAFLVALYYSPFLGAAWRSGFRVLFPRKNIFNKNI